MPEVMTAPSFAPEYKSPYAPTGDYTLDKEGYLIGDGEPMAESEEHQDAITYAIFALKTHFAGKTDVYVAGNNFVHYEEGDRFRHVSPDCYVVFGVDNIRVRRNFKIWQEGATPSVVFEFTSRETQYTDATTKFTLYEQTLKVAEYYRFDPHGEYMRPRLKGAILTPNGYEPMVLDNRNRLYSPALGLFMGGEETRFRFYDPLSGEPFLSPREEQFRADKAEEALNESERQLKEERKRAQIAEAEIAQLRAEIDALRKKD